MKTNQKNSGIRKVLVTLSYYLAIILAALLLGVTHQIADWVAQVVIALSLGRLLWLFAWGCAKNRYGWRV